jgi:UDP-N-acetylmuramyl tripeptide synthase
LAKQQTGKRDSVRPRTAAAISAGKLTGWLARRLGRGGGTALPGLVAERLDPRLMARMVSSLGRGAAIVSGTNGKTTTTRMLSAILKGAGWQVLHNRSGSNLMRGLVSTLVSAANLQGHLHEEFALFEVDEAATPAAVQAVQPRLLLINNLFRDQLDRYGEVDAVRRKWVEAISALGPDSVVLLNADAPAVASLGQAQHRARVRYFGLNDEEDRHNIGHLPHASDALNCPNCGANLIYDKVYSADSGIYHCPNGDFARPQPDYIARRVTLNGPDGSAMLIASPDDEREISVRVPGLYNAYNALAASAAACELGLSLADVQKGLLEFHAAFGRIEPVQIGDKRLLLALVKNPVGFNEVLRMLRQAAPLHLLIIINDLTADGRDVSWLWDVDFEILADLTAHVTTAGIRSDDMALRLKYAGVDASLISPAPADNLRAALDLALASTPADTTLYVLPTYTAMLQLRQLLGDMGVVGRFWED